MELARIVGSNYPYKMNVPVYQSAAVMLDGEMIMRHGTWLTDLYKYYITAYVASNAEADDALGVLQAGSAKVADSKENAQFYKIGSDTYPDADIADGGNYLPCIVNPHAAYFAFYDQTTAKSCTAAETAETTWEIALLEDNISGGWLFTTDQADANATYVGKLRYIKTSPAAGSITCSAVTVDTSTDFCKVIPVGQRLTSLNTDATGLQTEIAAGDSVFLEPVENWISHSGSPEVQMRYWDHDNLDGLQDLKVRAEVMMVKHCWLDVV